jgi:hypothetical protein
MSDWISVKDRLPDFEWPEDNVLVYSERGYTNIGQYEGQEADMWINKYTDDGYITHWMLLPPPPTVDNNKDKE